MSGEEDLRTLRGVYDDWARGQFWEVSAYDPEIEFVLGPSLPEPGTYHGHAGMEKGFRGWLDSWRALRFEAEEFIDAGEGRIVVLYRQTGIGRTSGAEAELHGGHVWTMRDGKAVRLEVHAHRREAIEAAGLTE
jgi:ketosteroid isomerase-like protein